MNNTDTKLTVQLKDGTVLLSLVTSLRAPCERVGSGDKTKFFPGSTNVWQECRALPPTYYIYLWSFQCHSLLLLLQRPSENFTLQTSGVPNWQPAGPAIRDALDGHTSYSGTLLFQTSEMWTPHFNGHFLLKNGLHSHSHLYIITSEMWTSHYSINRTEIFCTKMKYSYKLEQFIETVSMLVLWQSWPVGRLHRYFLWVTTEQGLGSLHVSLWPTQTIDAGCFQPIAFATIDFLTSNLCCPLVEGPLREVRTYRSQIERNVPDNPSTSDIRYG